jgi:hypothetical protein
VSLGVSDYHALFAAAQLRIPAGDKAWVAVEGSLDAFVGGPPEVDDPTMEVKRAELPRGTRTCRGGLTGGYHISETLSAFVFMEAAKVPGVNLAQVVDNNIALIPYEPIFTGGLGIAMRFGGPQKVKQLFTEKDCSKRNPPDCPAVKVAITTEISGTVIDTSGKPVVGAKVLLTLKNSQVEPVVTDDKGTYVFKGVRIGDSLEGKENIDETAAEVSVEAGGMKPNKATVPQLAKGTNTVAAITLDAETPPGELRGNVRALKGGKPITGATITIEPGGLKTESQADGSFQINLAPGQYKIKVSAPGKTTQELDVTIETNGVAIKNIDLQ